MYTWLKTSSPIVLEKVASSSGLKAYLKRLKFSEPVVNREKDKPLEEIRWNNGAIPVGRKQIAIEDFVVAESRVFIDVQGRMRDAEYFLRMVLPHINRALGSKLDLDKAIRDVATSLKVKMAVKPEVLVNPKYLKFAHDLSAYFGKGIFEYDTRVTAVNVHYEPHLTATGKRITDSELEDFRIAASRDLKTTVSLDSKKDYEEGLFSVFSRVDSETLLRALTSLERSLTSKRE